MILSRAAGAPLAALALSAVPASAQVTANLSEAIVVTGERIKAAQKEVEERPGAADLVTADEYDQKVAVSLRDALAFSPGVYAQPRFGQEVRLSIRGSGISRAFHMRGLTLLQDGIPINLADDNGDFQELDPQVYETIQVFRGANGLRFGSSTLGGAINGVTPMGLTSPGVRARVDGGSFETLRGFLSGGYASGPGDAWFAISGDRSDGEREHSRRRSLRFHGNVGLRLGSGVTTRLYASGHTIEQDLPGALPLNTVLTHPKTGNFAGDQARDINSLRLQSRTEIKLGNAVLTFGGFLNQKELHHPVFQVVDQQLVDRGGFARVNWAAGPLALALGVNARFGTVDARRFVNVNGARGGRTFEADLRAQTIDAYGEARYGIGALSIIAGGVYTHGERNQEQSFPIVTSGRATFSEFSPRFGLLWEPRSDLQIYANVSRSHELPGFAELAQIAAFVPLDAQRAWTGEIGARGQIGIAAFDVTVYHAEIRGELLQFTVGQDIPASTFNANRTLHRGIETGLDLQLASWARLRQVYQLNNFRFKNDAQYGDNRLPVIPSHLYRAELRVGPEAWGLAPSLEWVPDGAWADYANTLKAKGYVMLGLTAEASLSENLELFLDLRNLTNKKAVGDISAVIDYGKLQPFQRSIFYPVERRAVFGGLRARF